MTENAAILAAIHRLCAASPLPDIFGARHHGFVLNPPVAEEEVVAWERRYSIRLPADYRQFLTEVGNGGAGPNYGLFCLGERMDVRSLIRWDENDGIVGVLSEPFPHTEPWNDLTKYVNGALPLSDLGCALSHWLVVSGPEAGHVWCDYRSDYRGVLPFTAGGQDRVGFLQWYCIWLDEAVAALS